MVKASNEPTSSETPIPLSRAALEVRKFCSAGEAEGVFMQGIRDLRIQLFWRSLSATEPSRLPGETKTLAKVTNPNLQPSFVSAAHIGAYEAGRNLSPTHETIVGTRTTLN